MVAEETRRTKGDCAGKEYVVEVVVGPGQGNRKKRKGSEKKKESKS